MRGVGGGGTRIGEDHQSPVNPRYQTPFKFAGTIHSVNIEVTPYATGGRPMKQHGPQNIYSVSLQLSGSRAPKERTGALSTSTVTTSADSVGTAGEASIAIDVSNADAGVSFAITNGAGAAVTVTNGTTNVAQTITVAAMGGTVGDSQVLNFDALGVTLTMGQPVLGVLTGTELAVDLAAGGSIVTTGQGNASFRVGSETTDNVTVGFSDLRASALGGTGTTLSSLVTDNQSVASVTLTDGLLGSLDTTISQVSTQCAKLGATQNQMESAINSVGISIENLSASESRIRDASDHAAGRCLGPRAGEPGSAVGTLPPRVALDSLETTVGPSCAGVGNAPAIAGAFLVSRYGTCARPRALCLA